MINDDGSVEFSRKAINRIFEADDQHDPTKNFHLEVFREEEGLGVTIAFVEDDRGKDGSASIRGMMWIDADQCEELGNNLIAAAQLIRKSE